MPITHRSVSVLPDRPRARAIAKDLRRSYPVGHLDFSRAYSKQPMELTICNGGEFPAALSANLLTTINADRPGEWMSVPFVRTDPNTFTCRITPNRPGLYSFRAVFSIDAGQTWLQDPVPDAWVLVDPPQVDQMRQYTMIPTVSGSIADWTKDLDRIKDMGFNAVHLLPITRLDTSQSPYSAHDLFDIDRSYLTTNVSCDALCQLEGFIEKARELEVGLCFDLVLNHVGANSLMVQRAPEWIVPDQASPDGFRRARYWSDKGWLPWDDLVLIDYEHPSERVRKEIWNYMTEYALFWGKYADYTNGFVRFDNLHSTDRGFAAHVARALRVEYPNLAIISEYFTDAGTLLNNVPAWGLNLVLATPWDQKFVPQLRDYLKYLHSISDHIRFFMPVTSHDSGTPAQEFAAVEATIPRYVASAFLGTGATGITQGVEWGQERKIEFIGRQPKIHIPLAPRFAPFIRKVNQLIAEYPIFRRGENCQFVDNGHHAVIAAFRKDDRPGTHGFLVVCNFDIMGEQEFETDLSTIFGKGGPLLCRDILNDINLTFPSALVKLPLEKCSARVLMF